MSKIVHWSGDEPFTIRTLLAIAEREGYDLDLPLSTRDPETEEVSLIRGIALSRPHEFLGECIDLDFWPDPDWYEDDHQK